MRRRRFISLLGGAALAPLAVPIARAEAPDGCGIPIARDDGWPVVDISEDRLIDRAALCGMADRLASSEANVHAVLVARGGRPPRSVAAGSRFASCRSSISSSW
jgi:hypothetical protein